MSLDSLLKDLQDNISESQERRAQNEALVGGAVSAAMDKSKGRSRRGKRGGPSRSEGRGRGNFKAGKFSGGNPAFADKAQIKNAIQIAQTGRKLGASRRDIVTALATGLVESNLHNVNYGDRDSIGIFQQRNAWGPKKVRLNPHKSARMFFKGGRAGQEGLFDIKNRDRLPIGVNAQDVQVSAFPGRYAQRVDEARQIMEFITRGRHNKAAGRRLGNRKRRR